MNLTSLAQFTNCPGDLNLNGTVDDADFVGFVQAYDLLDCADPAMPPPCAADLNGDLFVDDGDFVVFVSGYNELVCVRRGWGQVLGSVRRRDTNRKLNQEQIRSLYAITNRQKSESFTTPSLLKSDGQLDGLAPSLQSPCA